MKHSLKCIISFGIMSLGIGACSPKLYDTVHNPAPLFKNKGDVYIDATAKLYTNYELTVGYAPTKTVGTYAGFSHNNYTTSSYFKEYVPGYLDIKTYYLGLGLFKNEIKSLNFRYEVFAEFGKGSYKIRESDLDFYYGQRQHFNGEFDRISLLINLASTGQNRFYTHGYSLRIGQLNYYNNTFSDIGYWHHYLDWEKASYHTIVEQSYFGRLGKRNLKFQFQIGYNYSNNICPYRFTTVFTTGLIFNPNIYGKNQFKSASLVSPISK